MSLPIKKLGLGGGAAKGILHIGALLELQKHQPLVFPDGVYGTSIGAIIGACIAFGIPFDDTFIELIKTTFKSFRAFIPSVSFQSVRHIFSKKGLFSMDKILDIIINLFSKYKIDARTVTLGQAKMPLFILASNITKNVPTIFKENIILIDALRCSCAVPIIFHPQELYGQLYVDGDILVPHIGTLVKDVVVFSLDTNSHAHITPNNLHEISILVYFTQLYDKQIDSVVNLFEHSLTLHLLYPKLFAESNLEEFDLDDIFKYCGKSMRSFLSSKSFL